MGRYRKQVRAFLCLKKDRLHAQNAQQANLQRYIPANHISIVKTVLVANSLQMQGKQHVKIARSRHIPFQGHQRYLVLGLRHANNARKANI
tara:strand:+ start:7508 stop:7780 length:273 start_codon:yes stop_codon:yes gene_type:complete